MLMFDIYKRMFIWEVTENKGFFIIFPSLLICIFLIGIWTAFNLPIVAFYIMGPIGIFIFTLCIFRIHFHYNDFKYIALKHDAYTYEITNSEIFKKEELVEWVNDNAIKCKIYYIDDNMFIRLTNKSNQIAFKLRWL